MPLVPDYPVTQYDAHPGVRSTMAKIAYKSLQLFKDHLDGIVKQPDKPHFQIGRLVHEMVLEPDKFKSRVVDKGPINPKTGEMYGRDTKAFAEWQATNPDKTVVEPEILRMFDRMPVEVAEVFGDGQSEVSCFSNVAGLDCKARFDWINDCIWDLKTIENLDDMWRDIRKNGYIFSAAWYRMCDQKETGRIRPYRLVFAEKSAPHRWAILPISDGLIAEEMKKVDFTIEKINRAISSGDWSADHYVLCDRLSAPDDKAIKSLTEW